MNAQLKAWQNDRTIAHVAPLMWFLIVSFLLGILAEAIGYAHPSAPWWKRWPDTWILTVQTFTTAGMLLFFWKHYELKWSTKAVVIGAVMGAIGIGFWLMPTMIYDRLGLTENPEGWMRWLGINDRLDGFDPNKLGDTFWIWAWIIMRFFRAVVVVALIEEVAWRSFLMRFLLKPDGNYWKVPFGKPAWISFFVVTFAFMFAHAPIDYAMAFIYGALTYLCAIWTKSLMACVVMHGVANFIMCWFALEFGKFGLL